jgi:hypothetical protein
MAFKTKPYRLIPLSRIILAKLYEQHVNDEPKDRFTVDEVAELFSVPVSRNLIASALARLHSDSKYQNQKLVIRRGLKSSAQPGYAIGDYGIQVVEGAMLQKNSDIAYYMANGDSAIDDIAGLDGIYFTDDERLEKDDWAPLQIDRATTEYSEATSSLEKAIEAIRTDNGFAVQYPLEREGILNSLGEGLEWLKNKAPSRAQIKSLLIAPLNWVAVTFGNAVTGQAAKLAAQKLFDFILSFF